MQKPRFSKALGLLCLLGVVPPPLCPGAVACPPAGVRAIASAGESDPYEAIKRRVLGKLRKKDRRIVTIEPFKQEASIRLRLLYPDREEIVPGTYVEAWTSGGTLGYEADTHPDFRGRGINRLLLAYFLREHPEVRSTRIYLLDTNQLAFLYALADGLFGRALLQRTRRMHDDTELMEGARLRGAAEKLLRETREPEAVIALRERITRAVIQHTPAGRIQSSLGMGRLVSVVIGITPDPFEPFLIQVVFARGVPETRADADVAIKVADVGEAEFLSSGVFPHFILLPDGGIETKHGRVVP